MALLGVILGGLVWLGYGMDWANTAHDFYVNYLTGLTPNQLQQAILTWIYNFLTQPVSIGPTSVPLVAIIAIFVAGTAYFKSSR